MYLTHSIVCLVCINSFLFAQDTIFKKNYSIILLRFILLRQFLQVTFEMSSVEGVLKKKFCPQYGVFKLIPPMFNFSV